MEWKDIKGFEGYQVSDTGLIRTHDKVTHTEHHGDRHWKDRILKPRKSRQRRSDGRVALWKDRKPHDFIISRLVAFTFLGKDIQDTSLTVNHKNGDFNDNNLKNLEIVSLADNIKHAFDSGLMSQCHKIEITNKATKETIVCRSAAEASIMMGKSIGYINSTDKRGKYENEEYAWRHI